jgi:hypothetical protein
MEKYAYEAQLAASERCLSFLFEALVTTIVGFKRGAVTQSLKNDLKVREKSRRKARHHLL